MTTILLFSTAAEAARVKSYESTGLTVAAVLQEACDTFGLAFAEVLACSRVWLNDNQVNPTDHQGCGPDDAIVVLPPVSGG